MEYSFRKRQPRKSTSLSGIPYANSVEKARSRNRVERRAVLPHSVSCLLTPDQGSTAQTSTTRFFASSRASNRLVPPMGTTCITF